MGIVGNLARSAYGYASLRTLSVSRAQRALATAATHPRRFVICLPYLKSGGAERVAANIAHAFSHLYGADSVAVLVTDWSGLVVRLIFPENVFANYPHGVHTYPLSSDEIVRNVRSDKELGHDRA